MGTSLDTPTRVLIVARSARGDECAVIDFIKPNNSGYVFVWHEGRRIGCHRFVCAAFHGKPVGRFDAAHSCGNRRCVNPAHLRWATHQDNLADRRLHGTDHGGERHPAAKLTNGQATELREQYRDGLVTVDELMTTTGLSRRSVYRLLAHETYREVA